MKIKDGLAEKGLMQGDMVVWMIFICLCAISVIEVYSASSNMTYETGHYWEPVMRHSAFVLVGIAIAWLIHLVPFRWFKLANASLLIISIILLIIALALGQKINGGARWLVLGGIKFQPSELAKMSLVGFSCFILSTFRDENGGASKNAVKLTLVVSFIVLGLIASENLSTAGIIFIVILGILFYAQAPHKYLVWIVGLLIGGLIFGLTTAFALSKDTELMTKLAKSDGPFHRVPTWVHRITDQHELPENPKDYDITNNIQVTHAHIAVATCGIIGKGPGNSVERDYLPHSVSDFIYAIIIEEGGIGAGAGVMFLYLLLMWRAIKISKRTKALFPSYLVMGLALMMVVQAMVNMAVAVGAFPVTGQPLPLISRGGTATFVNCAYIGMILSVSHTAKKTEKALSEEKTKKI